MDLDLQILKQLWYKQVAGYKKQKTLLEGI